MKLIGPTTWDEVFAGWKAREASNPGWVNCATVIKGWPDWESWRRFTAEQIRADRRDWESFEFSDPLNEIPELLLGPYSGWQSAFPHKNTASFNELLDIPEQYERFAGHDGVRSIMNGIPFSTELIGLIRDDDHKIVCIDGHHRAVAIALAKRQERVIDFGQATMTIALTHLPKDECGLLDEVLARGTSKDPLSSPT